MATCFMGHPFSTDTKAAKFCQYTEKVQHRDANGGEHCHPSLLYTRSTVHHESIHPCYTQEALHTMRASIPVIHKLYTRSTVQHGPKTCVLDLDLAEMMTLINRELSDMSLFYSIIFSIVFIK